MEVTLLAARGEKEEEIGLEVDLFSSATLDSPLIYSWRRVQDPESAIKYFSADSPHPPSLPLDPASGHTPCHPSLSEPTFPAVFPKSWTSLHIPGENVSSPLAVQSTLNPL